MVLEGEVLFSEVRGTGIAYAPFGPSRRRDQNYENLETDGTLITSDLNIRMLLNGLSVA